MKKKKVTLLVIISMLVMAILPVIATGCTKRENILKISNWSEYIADNVIKDFEAYYLQETGSKIKVKYETFDENEVMYSKVAMTKTDYDVVCPSDYLVEKMVKNNMLIALEPSLGNNTAGTPIEDYRNNISPMLMTGGGYFDYDPDNKYSRAYMWGTMGIMYAEDVISLEYLESKGWGALFDKSHENRIYMKNSLRDTFVAGSMYTLLNPASPYYNPSMSIEDALNTTEHNKEIQEMLISQKQYILGYDNDQAKKEIIEGKVDMALQWAGDALYAMTGLQEEEGISRDINYYIPKEGSNLFCDAWCIPKYARNTKAANMWINFMCRPDISLRNMDYVGYSSAVASEDVLNWATLDMTDPANAGATPIDVSYFFPVEKFGEGVKHAYIQSIPFPDKNVIARCKVMRDYGDNVQKMDEMWEAIKLASY